MIKSKLVLALALSVGLVGSAAAAIDRHDRQW